MKKQAAKNNFQGVALLICQTMRANSDNTASWAEIRDAVGCSYTVKNWMTEVRRPLQWLMDQGLVRRADNAHIHEAYVSK